MAETLRVRARGTALVQDIDALDANTKRFIGRAYKEVEPGVWGFVPTGEDAVVRAHTEYVRELKEGMLWPADEATAKRCGVKFDPTFGGEGKAPPVKEDIAGDGQHVAEEKG